jgi:hypothetical protein
VDLELRDPNGKAAQDDDVEGNAHVFLGISPSILSDSQGSHD